MPNYRYHCEKCGTDFETVESLSEHEKRKQCCPECGSSKVSWVPGRFFAVTSKKS